MSSFRLLNIQNHKTIKGQAKGYLTGVLYLAPADLSGVNICPYHELAGCKNSCLYTAGRGAMRKVMESRLAKTKWYLENRNDFVLQVVKDIEALIRKGKREDLIPAVRLNGTSDIMWEKVSFVKDGVRYRNIMKYFPDVQFYDYTKIPKRRTPKNYHITYSYSPLYTKPVNEVKNNIAVVFRGKSLPVVYLDRPVVCGDETDLRFLDKKGVVVGLYAKGKARKEDNGFVVL